MGSRNNKPGRIVKGTAKQPTLKDASGIWSLDEAMQAHRANAWPQPNLFQPVANSLRNSLGKTGYISREAPGRSGSQRKFTFSWWLKKNSNATSSQQHLFYSYDGSRLLQIFFERGGNTNPDCICVYGGGTDLRFTPVLRDVSAWYNIVIAVDIDQSTSANTIKCWINGVQITAVGTQGGSPGTPSYPTSTTNWPINQAGVYQRIGGNAGGGTMDGQFAEINFIDGAQLQPTLFGQFDTNNTWVPIPYTGSYGTNGFYLPFTNAATSQTLGYDASLNGTAIYDADQDPYRGSVALHLTGNGPAGGQNNTFVDSSTNNLAVTRNGDVTQGSFSPFPLNTNAPYNPSVHGASAYFDGSGDRLVVATSTSLDLTGDFTIEMWVNLSSLPSYSMLFDTSASGTAGSTMTELWVESSGAVVYYVRGSALLTTASSTITANTWNHIAIVKSGTSQVLYVNGSSRASATSSTQPNTGYSWFIGDRIASAPSGNYPIAGYISNFRITKGAAIYTASFTPANRPFGTLTTNLLQFSESLWDGNNSLNATSSASALQALAIDGYMNGVKLVESATSGARYVLQNTNVTSGTTYVHSVYAKAGERQFLQMAASLGFTNGNDFWVNYDLVGGTYSIQGANALLGTASITNVGGGWFRCAISSISTSTTTTGRYTMSIASSLSDSRLPAVIGDGVSGLYLSSPQLEIGTAPTNYVPTPANFSTAPSLLLNFANAAVTDTAGANNVITIGSSTITSSSKYGSGALTFNGSTDRLDISGLQTSAANGPYGSNPTLIPGTKDFTVEYWLNTRTGNDTYRRIVSSSNGAFTSGTFCMRHQPGSFLFGPTSGYGTTTYSTDFTLNTWTHVAYSRQGATGRGFINGRQVVTCGDTANYTEAIQFIGAYYNNNNGEYFNGSLDDVRITMGVARYTTDFTPPARALPEVGGKSFVTSNINAGVVKTFTTTGTTSWTAPVDVRQVEVLVVAGGGGGANYNSAGGGGAGGLIYNNAYPVTPGQTYTVTVGAGGAGGGTLGDSGSAALGASTSGGNSVFGALTAIGGGNGGQGNVQGSRTADQNPSAGGSGGGARGSSPYNVGGAGTGGQGFAGGNSGTYATNYPGGGGGGAGGPGGNGVGDTTAGNGGVGLQFGISGTSTYYAGGGGGSTQNTGTNSTGGLGGGGAGGSGSGGSFRDGVSGTANTGGGGGAGGFQPQYGITGLGGNGGSGIVIVRYTTTAVGNTSDATTDNLVDSPTLYGHDTGAGGEVVGNYATWNPLLGANYNNSVAIGSSIVVLSNGNLNAYNPALGGSAPKMQCHSNIGMTTGKWYAEFTGLSGRGAGISLGDYLLHNGTGSGVSNSLILQPTGGVVNPSTGASATVTGTAVAISTTDVVGVAFDVDNRVCYYYRNGVLTQTASNITTTLGTPYFSSGVWYFSSQPESSGSASYITANFGQRAWAYAPPAGFNALTTKNFARPAVGSAAATPNQFFDAVTYTGTGAAQTITLPGAFQPDLVWMKARSAADNHVLMDSVRGTSAALFSDLTNAEVTNATRITSFNSNGFTLGSSASVNTSSATYVAWCWRAGGTAVSNTSGTITSQASANTASGFSIVTYTGNGTSGSTVGHGLGATPSMVFVKARGAGVYNWRVYHSGLTAGYNVFLNAATAQTQMNTDGFGYIGGVASNTFTLTAGTSNSDAVNASGVTYLAYCWTEVPGFSKFGSYVGNGNADGPFVYTGFRPAFILTKDITTGTYWWEMVDSARSPLNPTDKTLYANVADTEYTSSTYNKDLLSNGFKIRGASGAHNTVGSTYIYMAFAGKSFGNINGTAR